LPHIVLAFIFLTIPFVPSLSGAETEDEFWNAPPAQPVKGWAELPENSFVYAGMMGYFNFSGPAKDIKTAGFKISANMREMMRYLSVRLDGFVGIGGPAEGLIEADFTLIKGLSVGLGFSYTKRLKLSPRFGLFVEDQKNPSRRGGLFLLESGSGGLEVSWPILDQWSFYGEIGVEKADGDEYTRIVTGAFYKF